ncbi:Zinc finger protein ZAT5 [Striga hermonthica]|uniref:Zinc finger protein ZAT5 n=1 Tax=Striga hermonthica TaxID=68872 RepID=A0A9N7N8E4_STRHE|nr:Zinc finger protein ZAT5 [Striga hermonthica]
MTTNTTEEEVAAAAPPPCRGSNCLSPNIAKGKRTKRQRPHSPTPSFPLEPSRDHAPGPGPGSSPASSNGSTTTEEEDTARCLIFLARSHFPTSNKHPSTSCMYACKTCNRAFTSFQALGGHRASHKKPKNEPRKPAAVPPDKEDFVPASKRRMLQPSSLHLANVVGPGPGPGPKMLSFPRVHECSCCGAEFASGQALGGHMRRHWAGPAGRGPEEGKRQGNGPPLDLNQPAPEDENQRFRFVAREQQGSDKLVLSSANSPTLIHCHY